MTDETYLPASLSSRRAPLVHAREYDDAQVAHKSNRHSDSTCAVHDAVLSLWKLASEIRLKDEAMASDDGKSGSLNETHSTTLLITSLSGTKQTPKFNPPIHYLPIRDRTHLAYEWRRHGRQWVPVVLAI
ncbi:hypothetical protein BDQ17DRAFT_1433457 [Cyathus striatus]|nr:hypothetical protein BDQ17DRAFT_1433457 [Cyathus striatus]